MVEYFYDGHWNTANFLADSCVYHLTLPPGDSKYKCSGGVL